MEITLTHANTADLPLLAEINRLSYFPETISQFAFTNWPDEAGMFNFFTARVKEWFSHPDTMVFKVVEATTGEIVGFVCWTLEYMTEDESRFGEPVPTPTATATHQMPAELNMKFIMATGGEIEKLRDQMKGTNHYYLSRFVVAPKYQRKGIGSQIPRYCLDIADKAKVPTWLISFPGSHNLYLRFGFKDAVHNDTDLNEWDNFRFWGFGIYRSYAMLRQPEVSGNAA